MVISSLFSVQKVVVSTLRHWLPRRRAAYWRWYPLFFQRGLENIRHFSSATTAGSRSTYLSGIKITEGHYLCLDIHSSELTTKKRGETVHHLHVLSRSPCSTKKQKSYRHAVTEGSFCCQPTPALPRREDNLSTSTHDQHFHTQQPIHGQSFPTHSDNYRLITERRRNACEHPIYIRIFFFRGLISYCWYNPQPMRNDHSIAGTTILQTTLSSRCW